MCPASQDSAAQRALNVFPARQDANTAFSLYGLLNRSRTAMGKRRLRSWLKQPLVDVAAIDARLDVVESLVTDAELRERLRDSHLRGEMRGRGVRREQGGSGGVRLPGWLGPCAAHVGRPGLEAKMCVRRARARVCRLPAGLPDVERLTRKLDARKGVSLGDLCALYRCSARLPLVEDALRAHEGPHAQQLVDRCGAGGREVR